MSPGSRPTSKSARHLVLLAALGFAQAAQAREPLPAPQAEPTRNSPSIEAARLVASVLGSGDTHGLPFLVVDKVEAKVFAFDAQGRLLGSSPALVGVTRGDVSPKGIGDRRLADIPPADRITPAGRFEAALGHNLSAKDILWIDYDAALSLHRVATGVPSERRLQRLATPTALDNRISYGCINVPAAFYDGVVLPLFRPANGLVYILPEMPATAATDSTMVQKPGAGG
jgi:hypothetical protein